MNTLQIHYFLSIVENQSFSKASAVNYVSQPTLSKHIKNLEEELQIRLFDRTKNPIELTPMGMVYHKLFTDFMADLSRIKNYTQKQKGLYEGTIRIGILTGFNLPDSVTNKFRSFQELFPKTSLSFENHNVKDILDRLKNGSLDTCLTLVDFVSQLKNVEYIVISDIPKYLVYSEKILAKRDDTPISLADFKDEVFFCLGEEHSDPTKRLILEYCKYYGLYPTIKSIPNMESVMSNVSFGNGVTILDGLTQYNEAPHIKKLEIQPCHKLCLAWLSERRTPLIDLLKEQFA
ncbi:MAG: LysR family transcriptional regulator [Clostridiales bacterium]|nr:LysR family transcriptional regulator [Clostridiales bacterium]